MKKTTMADFVAVMESMFPLELAEEWDNSGLLIGSLSRKIDKVGVCVDVTNNTWKEAVSLGCDAILAHHPLIFSPMTRLTDQNTTQKLVRKCIQSELCLYVAHTNLDLADQGLNDMLMDRLSLQTVRKNSVQQEKACYGRMGRLKAPMTSLELAKHVSGALDLSHVRMSKDCNKECDTVFVWSGSFDYELFTQQSQTPDAIVTGEAKYHDLIELADREIVVITTGHFEIEAVFKPYICQRLSERLENVSFYQLKEEMGPLVTVS